MPIDKISPFEYGPFRPQLEQVIEAINTGAIGPSGPNATLQGVANDAGTGGSAEVLGGAATGGVGDGGSVTITAANTNSPIGFGGQVSVTTGQGAGGPGDLFLAGAAALAGSGVNGGNLFSSGGAGDGVGPGGNIELDPGHGGAAGAGGAFTVTAGQGNGAGHGGDIDLTGGAATGTGRGGHANLFAGGSTGGPAGEVNIVGGNTAAALPGGNVSIEAGAGGTGNGLILLLNLPTVAPATSGALWRDPAAGNVVKCVP